MIARIRRKKDADSIWVILRSPETGKWYLILEEIMRTTKIQIRDILGIREFNMNGESIELSGSNGVGKSSVLDAIRYALTNKSGRDVIVRRGAVEGEILIETDSGLSIDRKSRINRADYKSIKQNGREIGMERIKRTCQRATLAEQAIYSYPRGGQTVMGPSIRLAEALAQNWGNIDYGVIELEQKNGSSEMMAYAWDLESNTRVTKIFTVEHKRDTRKGTYQLTDSRDIYEATANFGARRMRACILGVIPGDVVDMAVGECKETVRKGIGKEPINERVTKLINAFKVEFKVTREQIEKYAERNCADFGEDEFINLKGVYKALKDGQAKAEDYFPVEEEVPNPMGGAAE